jgi:hypothetical protein
MNLRALLRRGYLFTVLGVAGLVTLGAIAERISRFIEGGDRFVLGCIGAARSTRMSCAVDAAPDGWS